MDVKILNHDFTPIYSLLEDLWISFQPLANEKLDKNGLYKVYMMLFKILFQHSFSYLDSSAYLGALSASTV